MTSGSTFARNILMEQAFRKYAEDFAQKNGAARTVARGLSLVGVGLRPLLDHLLFRTLDPKSRAKEFLDFGYEKDPAAKILSTKGHSVEVYRRGGCNASILIEYPFDKTGQDWVKKYGDRNPYVLAVRVEDVEEAVFRLEKQSVGFQRPIAGKKEDTLRQIAALPVMEDGMIASYVALVERHATDHRFYASDFWTAL